MAAWGYLRTSKQQQDGQDWMDPETQELAQVSDGVPVERVFRDVGISGTVAPCPGAACGRCEGGSGAGIWWWSWRGSFGD